ncbi:hypothetical protein [Ectobacillus ponti]|uniref:Uncharacterized protein n=1 Tax=Ectobacillus ponti TaxID=2961894 RepID=A0AA41XCC9_9BACI|nr:hypothetical protein [Ectobacillus ponti]MCP8970835.1 hypothetical protein [Ectobacillus ponti]
MKKDKTPNVSGTFQTAHDPSESRAEDLKELQKKQDLDEESMYCARLFMED